MLKIDMLVDLLIEGFDINKYKYLCLFKLNNCLETSIAYVFFYRKRDVSETINRGRTNKSK